MSLYNDIENCKDFKLVCDFLTKQCNIMIFDTNIEMFEEKIYCIASRHLNDLSVNIRFGNKQQVESIIKSYKYSIEKWFIKEDF